MRSVEIMLGVEQGTYIEGVDGNKIIITNYRDMPLCNLIGFDSKEMVDAVRDHHEELAADYNC